MVSPNGAGGNGAGDSHDANGVNGANAKRPGIRLVDSGGVVATGERVIPDEQRRLYRELNAFILGETFIGVIRSDQLYLKITDPGRALLPAAKEALTTLRAAHGDVHDVHLCVLSHEGQR